MEFLNNFVLPQSAEHIELLHYMLLIVLFLFIPFISIVFGGIILSVVYGRIGERENNRSYLRLAKQISEITTINKSVGFMLGISPVLTAILIYSQLLHNSLVTNLDYLAFAFVFITIALVFIYSHRYSLSFNQIFSSFSGKEISDPELTDDMHKISEESHRISRKSGIYGIIFLFLGLWFFVTAMTIPIVYDKWKIEDILSGLFSLEVLTRFIFYVLFALTLTGGMILYSLFDDENKKKVNDDEYLIFVKHKIVKIAFFVSILLPVFLLISIFGLPASSLTGTVFFYAIVSLILLFLGYHFMYLLSKQINGTIASLLFFTLIFSVASFIISDQKAMETATKFQTASLSANFDKYLAELKGEGKTVTINAAELYQVRCSSCHKWDQVLVGPAHFDVLPKYEGNEAKLEAFIRNPTKVDPDFPPMPNPGLKPNEAKALAKYLLESYNARTK